jgi:AcrR family transcriptional regulator
VAREAGVAAGTVYLYYESKLDLFAALSAMLFEAIGRAVNETPAPPDVRGGTAARVHAVFEACSEYRDLVRLVFLNPDPRSEAAKRMQRQDEARMRPLQSLLEQGMETGVVRRADPKILVRMINGAVITALHLSFVQSDGRHAATYEELVTDMIVGALEPRERSQEVARPA